MTGTHEKTYTEGKKLRRGIRVLTRRHDFLGQRLAGRPRGSFGDKGDWDLAEFRALAIALELMRREFEGLPREEQEAALRSDEDQKGN